MGGSISAACVPVNFMGRALGVLHVTGAKGKPPNPEQIAQLTALGVHAGTRIGTLRAFERSQLQASTDSLTGLMNRRAAEEVLNNLMAVDSEFAVVLADLDSFKRLNDTQGHEAGDRALKLFADTAIGVVRDRDHVVRWGGEEFAMLLPGANVERAAEVVGRLRVALAQGASAVRYARVHGQLRDFRFDHDARARDADPARRRSAVSLQAGGTRLLHDR
jgi:diguanylate cyclase (GGDEF)-like protein